MDKVIKNVVVSAETMHHDDYRRGTVAGALASVLAEMKPGEVVCVTKCLDAFGQLVHVKKIRDKLVYIVNQHNDVRLDGVRFSTSSTFNGLLITKAVDPCAEQR